MRGIDSVLPGEEPQLSLAARLWRVNWLVVLLTAMIAGVGTLGLYSVAGGSLEPWAERHAARFVLALAAMLSVAVVPQRFWLGAAYPVYFAALGLLALVPLVGTEAMGARRWLGIGWAVLQPSEIMKVALILALARYFQWLPHAARSRPLALLPPLLAIAAPVALTVKQPDLGTAILFAVSGLAVMFLAGVGYLYFLGGLAAALFVAPFAWRGLHDYQRRRLEIFLDPEKDPLGAGYHITQSKIALGSGGLEGKGFMAGTQSQLDFLPEKHTDFIFTTLGEEWGFIGAIALLAMFATLITLVLAMGLRAHSPFARLLIGGTAASLTTYVVINVAMVTGLLPVVGVPLPLVSYGGSSMIGVMTGLGLAMSAHAHRRERIRRDDVGMFW